MLHYLLLRDFRIVQFTDAWKLFNIWWSHSDKTKVLNAVSKYKKKIVSAKGKGFFFLTYSQQ